MNKTDLISHLKHHLANAQKSERWAMYRLITPIVDYANQKLGLNPFFEFNQTSAHGTHQSIDIALLDENEIPQVLVEAKRVGRILSAEQISKYLTSKQRGVVTNGEIWILCDQDRHACVSLLKSQPNGFNTNALDLVIRFLQLQHIKADFTDTPTEYKSALHPLIVNKDIKAIRSTHPKAIATLETLPEMLSSIDSKSELEKRLLEHLAAKISDHETMPSIRVEVRKTRISFFDESSSDTHQRIARIELGKSQPDVLVKKDLVDENGQLQQMTSTIHDKGAHMRRFRIGSLKDAERLAAGLAKLLLTKDER